MRPRSKPRSPCKDHKRSVSLVQNELKRTVGASKSCSDVTRCGFLSVASMRLAYKELEIDRKMEEKKLQNLEGKKREQAERLGMGFGGRRCRFCYCLDVSNRSLIIRGVGCSSVFPVAVPCPTR